MRTHFDTQLRTDTRIQLPTLMHTQTSHTHAHIHKIILASSPSITFHQLILFLSLSPQVRRGSRFRCGKEREREAGGTKVPVFYSLQYRQVTQAPHHSRGIFEGNGESVWLKAYIFTHTHGWLKYFTLFDVPYVFCGSS